LAGIPRAELIDYVRGAAEALDALSREYSVQHLALNPRTLLLDNDCLRLADFGLAQLVWLPAGNHPRGETAGTPPRNYPADS